MADLTPEGQRIVEDAAQRYSMSADAVRVVLEALVASGGGMAQFNHPDLGGMGQWSGGGMIMIGDMFNNGLKSRIAALCAELSEVVGRIDIISYRPPSSQWQSQGDSGSMPLPASSFFVGGNDHVGSGGNWWPSDLGMPGSTGAQNNLRYACFPDRRRLALDVNGRVSVYDTGDHWITGFSQQQGGDQSLLYQSARDRPAGQPASSLRLWSGCRIRSGWIRSRTRNSAGVASDRPTCRRDSSDGRRRHLQQHRAACGPTRQGFHLGGGVLRQEDRAS